MISNNYDTKQSVSFNAPVYVNTVLMTGSAITVTVPTSFNGIVPALAVVSSTGNFYARFSGSASIPVATVTDGTGSMLNPTYFRVSAGQTFSVIGAAGVMLTIAFYGE